MENYHLQWIQKAIEDLTVVEHELSFPTNEYLQEQFAFMPNNVSKSC